VTRWEPDAKGRLQIAAIELFMQHGYDAVTVDDIAKRAGLTRRSFFNHFADKREVLFAGSEELERTVIDELNRLTAEMPPLDAALRALTTAGLTLARYREGAGIRRDIIASSSDLQERELIKLASLSRAIAANLAPDGVPNQASRLAAELAITTFTNAYDAWMDQPDGDFEHLMAVAFNELRGIVDTAQPAIRTAH
jgi:AcrR family transcriptional regulator